MTLNKSTTESKLTIPTHVAIIMDGNGRWATRNHTSLISGHRAGAEATRMITKKAADLGIKYLTLYAFSSENWKRPKSWVNDLMGLLRYYLKNEITELTKNNVRLKVIGNKAALDTDIQHLIEDAESRTSFNTGLNLQLALSYGSRDEILMAVQKIILDVTSGCFEPDQLTQEVFEKYLYTSGIPDPDLLIRTSGEMRISNFLLWQMAYTEFVFVDTLWPDFTDQHLEEALKVYQERDRRYGSVFAKA
jgi:undecaprenyl diphosphate synthase